MPQQKTNKSKALMFIYMFAVCMLQQASAQISNNDSLKYSAQLIRYEQQMLDAIAKGDTTTWNKYLN